MPRVGSKPATFPPAYLSPTAVTRCRRLATAFNRMTERLEEQTNALRTANAQLDTPARVHRGGAVERHRGGDRRRRAARHPAAQPLGGNASRAEAEPIEGKALGPSPPSSTSSCAAEQSEANVLITADVEPADARGQASALSGRVGADLRRHHRPADRPAPRRLVRHRAAHRARDQEPADPDPARGRAAAAPVRQARSRPTPRRSSG